MNKDEISSIMGEIMEYATRITLTSKAEVLLELRGHVNTIGVRIYNDGWCGFKEPDYYENFDIDKPSSLEKLQIVKGKLAEMVWNIIKEEK